MADSRLLVVEPEFVSVLKATGRDINTLSPVLRAAWDGRPLALLTRTAPVAATKAHIAVIGHITATELAAHTKRRRGGQRVLEPLLLHRLPPPPTPPRRRRP